MNKRVFVTGGVSVIATFLLGAAGIGSLGSLGNVFEMLGGTKGVMNLANEFVSSSIRDPRLAALLSGNKIDAAAMSGKVVSPDQSKAIWDNFNSALSKAVSDPMVRELVTKTVGTKIPGVLAGLL